MFDPHYSDTNRPGRSPRLRCETSLDWDTFLVTRHGVGGVTSASAERWIGRESALGTVRRATRRAGAVVFGDRLGVILFLAGLVFVTSYWRIGIFVSDSYALGNTLVNVADGHLAVRNIQYSLTFGSQPGLYDVDGTIYGRNYGHVFLSLPVLWVLQGLSAVFDPRLALAGGWSVLLFVLIDQVGYVRNRRPRYALAGSVLALLCFGTNAALASPLDETWLPLVALQLTTMVAAAGVMVALYRLFAHVHGRRVGLLVGILSLVATPVGFWAPIPKRHVFTALAVVVVLGAFYASRTAASARRSLAFRSLSYAVVALLAWLHAPEALMVLVALGAVDLLTARSNDPRRLAVVGLVFCVALAPFLATNYAISGNPVEPPRTHPVVYWGDVDNTADGSPLESEQSNGGDSSGEDDAGSGGSTAETTVAETAVAETSVAETTVAEPADGETTVSDSTVAESTAAETEPPSTATDQHAQPETTTAATGSGSETPPDDPGTQPSPIGSLLSILSSLLALAGRAVDGGVWALGKVGGFLAGGAGIVISDPERLFHVFVRSGRIPESVDYGVNNQEAIELTVLESAPLLAALAGAIVTGVRRAVTLPSLSTIRTAIDRPERQTDVLALSVAAMIVLVYITKLPLHAQITVRYLLPVTVIGLYGIGRLGPFRRVARADGRWIVGSYGTALVVSSLALVASHAWFQLALGEAMQLHALLALGSAGPLALWTVAASAGWRHDVRLGVVAFSLPAALSTCFVLFTGFAYFQYAEYAIPLAKAVAQLLPVFV